MELEAFELVLLRRPENPPDYDNAELERIQREHLAHHARLRASGQVVTNRRRANGVRPTRRPRCPGLSRPPGRDRVGPAPGGCPRTRNSRRPAPSKPASDP